MFEKKVFQGTPITARFTLLPLFIQRGIAYNLSMFEQERNQWKNVEPGKRWQYFKDYYLLGSVLLLIAVIYLGRMVYDMVKPKPEYSLKIAVNNGSVSMAGKTELTNEIQKQLPTGQYVLIDDGYATGGDMEDEMRLTIQSAAGEIDVVITDQETFTTMAENGAFMELTALDPSAWSSRYLMVNDIAYGISLTDSNFSLFSIMEDPVLGIIAVSTHLEEVQHALPVLIGAR